MATLPKTPFTLKGGCFCSAIKYTVSVPELGARPINPDPSQNPIGPQNEVTERLPMIDLDHCNSCRRVQGTVLQLWLILPQSWVQFSLQDKSTSKTIEPSTIDVLTGKSDVVGKTYVTHFSSSKGVNRTFCGRCGTNLTFHYEEPTDSTKKAKEKGLDWEPHMDLTFGSLDQEFSEMDGMRPCGQAFPEDGISWVKRWLKNGEKSLLE